METKSCIDNVSLYYLLISNKGESLVIGKASNAELSERTRASYDQHLQHSSNGLWRTKFAPFRNVYFLPAIRSIHCSSP